MLLAMISLMCLLGATPVANPRIQQVKKALLRFGFNAKEAESLFTDSRLKQINLGDSAKKRPMSALEKEMMDPESIARGRAFLKQHQVAITKAEKKYGIKAEILVALVRIESNLGTNPGAHLVLNVFYTKLLRYRAWSRPAQNFVDFLIHCRQNRHDWFKVTGSHAGAFGWIQFMPRSAILYAVDSDDDGKIDLFEAEDTISSAANFLAAHGYSKNPQLALRRYLGDPKLRVTERYAEIVLKYAQALQKLR